LLSFARSIQHVTAAATDARHRLRPSADEANSIGRARSLRAREPSVGKGGRNAVVRNFRVSAKTLADYGLSKDQSSRFQKLADVPEEQFERALAGEEMPTTRGLIEAAEPSVTPVATDALRLWKRAGLRWPKIGESFGCYVFARAARAPWRRRMLRPVDGASL
jgi:hypothetical protein